MQHFPRALSNIGPTSCIRNENKNSQLVHEEKHQFVSFCFLCVSIHIFHQHETPWAVLASVAATSAAVLLYMMLIVQPHVRCAFTSYQGPSCSQNRRSTIHLDPHRSATAKSAGYLNHTPPQRRRSRLHTEIGQEHPNPYTTKIARTRAIKSAHKPNTTKLCQDRAPNPAATNSPRPLRTTTSKLCNKQVRLFEQTNISFFISVFIVFCRCCGKRTL